MLGLDATAARWTWSAALVLVFLGLVYQLRATLFLFILAVLFAYLLSPAVDLLDRAFAGRTRTLALALVYVVFIGVSVGAVTQIGSRVALDAHALAEKFPAALESWRLEAERKPETFQQHLAARVRVGIMERTNEIISALPSAGVRLIAAIGNLIYVVIVPIIAFFFLKDGPQIRAHFLELIVGGSFSHSLATEIMADVHELLARYIRALVILSLNTFLCYAAFFTIVSLPYGILLAVAAMLLEFIPMIGPLVGGTLIVIVAAVSGGPVYAVLAFLLAFRLFQDYVLSPQVMAHGVELHPLLVLFGVFAGAEVAGIPGCFLSVPVLALVRIFYRRMAAPPLSATPQS